MSKDTALQTEMVSKSAENQSIVRGQQRPKTGSLFINSFPLQNGKNVQMYQCYWTDWQNEYDKQVLFSHTDWVVAGVQSVHDDGNEDRRFKYYLCKLGKHW